MTTFDPETTPVQYAEEQLRNAALETLRRQVADYRAALDAAKELNHRFVSQLIDCRKLVDDMKRDNEESIYWKREWATEVERNGSNKELIAIKAERDEARAQIAALHPTTENIIPPTDMAWSVVSEIENDVTGPMLDGQRRGVAQVISKHFQAHWATLADGYAGLLAEKQRLVENVRLWSEAATR